MHITYHDHMIYIIYINRVWSFTTSTAWPFDNLTVCSADRWSSVDADGRCRVSMVTCHVAMQPWNLDRKTMVPIRVCFHKFPWPNGLTVQHMSTHNNNEKHSIPSCFHVCSVPSFRFSFCFWFMRHVQHLSQTRYIYINCNCWQGQLQA